MRVLHIVPTYLPAIRYGGPIRSVHGLCKALAARGHEVHVFTTNVDGPGVSQVPTAQSIDVEGVKVWYFETGLGRRLYRSPAMGAALARKAATFDVLHLHSVFLWPTAAAARAARRSAVPYVVCPRGMLVRDLIQRKSRTLKNAWIEIVERDNLAHAASIHVTAEIEAEEYRRLGLPARRIDVIANGVELSTAAVSPTAQRNARPRVLSLGRISWKKGLDRLISAMAQVADAELVIAGNDEEGLRPRLEALAAEVGIADRTSFVGPVEGEVKWALIRSCDLFAMPSRSENFGIAALEAMACGRPVIVSPGVGLAKAIVGANAGVIAQTEPAELAAAIRGLLEDGALRDLLGRNAAQLATDQFSWDRVSRQAEEMYARCLPRLGTS